MDKLTEQYTLRVTPQIAEGSRKLTQEEKARMNHELRIIIAKHIHMSNFDPKIFLGDDE
jgi:hypothetical protein